MKEPQTGRLCDTVPNLALESRWREYQEEGNKVDTNNLFELGWLGYERSDTIKLLAAKADEYAGKGLSEWDTVSVFVEPVVRGLGWDTLDIRQVNRESRRREQLGDLNLLVSDEEGRKKLAVLIEAKQLDRSELDPSARQLQRDINERFLRPTQEGYNPGLRLEREGKVLLRGALTNGRRWLVYDFTAECSARWNAGSLIGEFDISALNDEAARSIGEALGRNSILRWLRLQR